MVGTWARKNLSQARPSWCSNSAENMLVLGNDFGDYLVHPRFFQENLAHEHALAIMSWCLLERQG